MLQFYAEACGTRNKRRSTGRSNVASGCIRTIFYVVDKQTRLFMILKFFI